LTSLGNKVDQKKRKRKLDNLRNKMGRLKDQKGNNNPKYEIK
jgi:hypothetical protein